MYFVKFPEGKKFTDLAYKYIRFIGDRLPRYHVSLDIYRNFCLTPKIGVKPTNDEKTYVIAVIDMLEFELKNCEKTTYSIINN